MNRDAAENYSTSLAKIGEGWMEQVAWAFQQDIPQALGLSRAQWMQTYYKHPPKLEAEERREAVRELTTAVEEGGLGLNNSEAADVLGVNEKTIRRDLNGSAYAEYEPVQDSKPQVDDLFDVDDSAYAEIEIAPEPTIQLDDGDEWYTPRWLFSALELTFSIDVCAPIDRTYSAVPAKRHFTIEDDGLAQRWDGTVWCNPPYSKPEPWARRMIHHGDGLLLTHMPMNAGWCVDVWDVCDAIRLFQAMEFVRPDGTSQRPGYWLQLAAFGTAATDALARVQPLGDAAFNKRRIASPMWRRAA